MIEERKLQGCIAVDMECSATLAVGEFRNIQVIQFFYGADSLDGHKREMRDLTGYGISHSDTYMTIALECGIDLDTMGVLVRAQLSELKVSEDPVNKEK